MDAFFDFLADCFMSFCVTLDLLGTVGGFLFLLFLLWAVTSRNAYEFFRWIRDEFFR